MPMQTFDGRELYPTLFHKAAVLLRSLIKNHPFVDRNKRTALLATLIFLEDNGYELLATEDELLKFVLKIARAHNPNRHKIKSWLERHSRRISKQHVERHEHKGKPPFQVIREIREFYEKAVSSLKSAFEIGEPKGK